MVKVEEISDSEAIRKGGRDELVEMARSEFGRFRVHKGVTNEFYIYGKGGRFFSRQEIQVYAYENTIDVYYQQSLSLAIEAAEFFERSLGEDTEFTVQKRYRNP